TKEVHSRKSGRAGLLPPPRVRPILNLPDTQLIYQVGPKVRSPAIDHDGLPLFQPASVMLPEPGAECEILNNNFPFASGQQFLRKQHVWAEAVERWRAGRLAGLEQETFCFGQIMGGQRDLTENQVPNMDGIAI